MKISNIETRYHDNCNFIYLSYSAVYYSFWCNMLYDMNFKATMNCISFNDHLADCILKW